MNNFSMTVARWDENARDQSPVDLHGTQGIELEKCDEVVWTEGEYKVMLRFSKFT